MKVYVKRPGGKTDLVEMKPKLYAYLSKKKKNGTFKRSKSIKKARIIDFRKVPKHNFGSPIWNFNGNDDEDKKFGKRRSKGKSKRKSKGKSKGKSKRKRKRRSFK